MEKRTILLLGGSAQQLPVIHTAREMGLRTVICDYLPDNPGQYIADKWYNVSTTDVDAVYDVAKKENVSGILAYASDPAALPAAIVSERLGLPTNPSTAVATLSEKHLFRRFLKQNGFACPAWVEISTQDTKENVNIKLGALRFPVVIKPTDSSGSKGVTIIKSNEELEAALNRASKFSRNGIIIAEEYIERSYPNIIGGDIFIQDRKIIFRGDMECVRQDDASLIPIMKVLPHHLSYVQRDLLFSQLNSIISKLGVIHGEFNIDAIIDKNNNPYLLEIGARAGGNMIPLQLSDAFGINLIEANIRTALGEKVSLNPTKPKGVYATYVIHSDQSGNFAGVEYSSEIQPYIYREYLYKSIGDRIELFDNARNAVGIVFLHFPDTKILCNFTDISKHIKTVIGVNDL